MKGIACAESGGLLVGNCWTTVNFPRAFIPDPSPRPPQAGEGPTQRRRYRSSDSASVSRAQAGEDLVHSEQEPLRIRNGWPAVPGQDGRPMGALSQSDRVCLRISGVNPESINMVVRDFKVGQNDHVDIPDNGSL